MKPLKFTINFVMNIKKLTVKNLKFLLIALFTILTVLTSCEKDETEQIDNLEQLGIFGQWKLETLTINGITDLSIQCCDYIEFKADSEIGDLKGEFRAYGVGYETNGVFEINTSNTSIQFDYGNTQKSDEFQISDDLIIFTYSDDNQEIIEDWRKVK
jgi:hypothetical protein